MEFVDEHNQVAYLEKSNVKSGPVFHQIVDFLNASSIRYALTLNPTASIIFTTGELAVGTVVSVTNFY